MLEKASSSHSTEGPEDPCKRALEMLKRVVQQLYNALEESHYAYLMPRQIDELTRWLSANVCKHVDDVQEQVEQLFAQIWRDRAFAKSGARPLKRSKAESLKSSPRRRYGYKRYSQVEKQIDSIDDTSG